MKWFRDKWFIVVFAISLFFPLYGGFLERNITLNGVTANPEIVELSKETIGNGIYQSYLNDLWEKTFAGKKILLKVRNQILYTVCNDAPNSNVVIGKDNYLFEPMYILYQIQAFPPSTEEYFVTLGSNLSALHQLLKENGKELYIFITPSKAHFYEEYIPDRYMFLSEKGRYQYTNYDKLLETLEASGIPYYDSINYIEKTLGTGEIDSSLYYKSGIHWSHMWGESASREFISYINSISKYELSRVDVVETVSDVPIEPDTDLYSSLNLLMEADEQWYDATMYVTEEGKDRPTVFLRGGSFMGQSLSALVKCGIFGEDVHFENNNYFMNQYSMHHTISSYNAYEEMELDTLVGKSDILILEVNEAAIPNMSWGFIDYLLEHPEYLDYNY